MASFRRLPAWLLLLCGMLLGATFTTTLTFHLQWCAAVSSRMDRQVRRPALRYEEQQQCVCGRELEIKLQDLADIQAELAVLKEKLLSKKKLEESLESNDELRGTPEPVEANLGSSMLSHTAKVHTSSLHHNEGSLRPNREGVVVGVVSRQANPQWVESVYDTWGKNVVHLLMFVGDDFNHTHSSARGLPLVHLSGVNADADMKAGSNLMISALIYLSKHYLSTHRWFVLTVDNSYLRVERLHELLSQLSPLELLYLGRAATGRKDQADKLGLKSHEHYCLGSSGIVLSSALLSQMKGDLQGCMRQDRVPDDVELGKCISAKLKIQCTQSDLTRHYFFEDYSKPHLTRDYIKQKQDVFPELITYHPVPSLPAMQLLHRHYKQLQFSSMKKQLDTVREQIAESCVPPSTSSHPLSPSSPSADCAPSLCPNDKCPNVGVVPTLPTPYQPTSIYDYQPWIYFDASTLYPSGDSYPTYRLKHKKSSRQELKDMLAKALQKVSERHGRLLKFKKLVNGWVRHNPFMGNEYIVDCVLVDNGKKHINKRINLVRPLASNYIVQKDNSDPATLLNIVVPLTNINQRFHEFMQMYERLALVKEKQTKLILSVYGKEDVQIASRVVSKYLAKHPHAKIRIVEGQGAFSRGKALHTALEQLAPNELIFICDVDMGIEPSFLERCRKNTILNKRVYYPEFFKLYNMDYVYWKQSRPKTITLKRSHGHWAYYSFGMLCIYKADYTAVGGMDTNIQGWGDEDVQFFNKVVRRRLEVMRAPDVALSHRWHAKHCSKELSKNQLKHCLSSQQENLADRRELAHYIMQIGADLKNPGTGAVVHLASNATADKDDDDQEYDYGG